MKSIDKTRSQAAAGFSIPDAYPAVLPYAQLAEFGARYDATMSEINRSGQRAQKARALDPQRREAWQTLRNAEKRLVIDLFFLQTDGAVFEDPQEQPPALVRPEPVLPQIESPDPAAIAGAVGRLPQADVPPTSAVPDPEPINPELWKLLSAVWSVPPPPVEIPPPASFLEEEQR